MLRLLRSFSNTPYVYDSNTNEMFNVDENVFNCLGEADGNISRIKDEKIKKSCEEAGIDTTPLPLEAPEDFKKELEKMNMGFTKLTLGVTHACNLRCKYCIYSGNYRKERTHENRQMSVETADKIIDAFFVSKKENKPQSVIFYGGEPFMNFPVIKHVVERLNKRGETVLFSATTNSVLLKNKEILDFVVTNNFIINISFDGPVQEIVRVNEKGKGTYNDVISVIETISSKYPEYYEKSVGFNVTVTPATNLPETVEFFNTHPLFKGKTLNIIRNYDPGNAFSRKYGLEKNEETLKKDFDNLRKEYSENYKDNPSFQNGCYLSIMAQFNKRPMGNNGYLPMNACCYPGLNGIFVDADGTCYACERAEHAPIGHIDSNPVNEDKVKSYVVKYYEIAKKHCPSCWAAKLCPKCYAHVKRGTITEENFLEECDNFRKSVLKSLELFATIKEKDGKAFDEVDFITANIASKRAELEKIKN
ncbi:MAG: radical SAM protein [Armatimonadota bacterium]